MKRMIVVFSVATVCLLSAGMPAVLATEKLPIIVVEGRTIVAFFPAVSKAEFEKDPDTNEALADFRASANQAREPLTKAGVEFHELYTHSFQVRVRNTVTTFHTTRADVGYYLVAPGRKPRIEYGVMTDADFVEGRY